MTKGDAGDGLDPVNELVHQRLAAGVALVTAGLGSEGDDANLEQGLRSWTKGLSYLHLDPGPVRLPHDGRAPAVPEAGALSVGAAGAHHVLGHDPVQGVAVLVG